METINKYIAMVMMWCFAKIIAYAIKRGENHDSY
jgi:hypothetical protein